MIGVKQDILLSLKQELIKVIQLINKTNQWYIPYVFYMRAWLKLSILKSDLSLSLLLLICRGGGSEETLIQVTCE